MSEIDVPRFPTNRTSLIATHNYYITLSRESRLMGRKREAAYYLNNTRSIAIDLAYFMPNGKEPF